MARDLRQLISAQPALSDLTAFGELDRLIRKHEQITVLREKAVDIMLAVDLIRLRDSYETAYLLSADGDFTPALEAVASGGADVFAASPDVSYALHQVVRTFSHLRTQRFADCYSDSH